MLHALGAETTGGFHSVDGTVEVPIDLMNVSSLRHALPRWRKALYEMNLPLRSIDEGANFSSWTRRRRTSATVEVRSR